jgi:hypothetical protein
MMLPKAKPQTKRAQASNRMRPTVQRTNETVDTPRKPLLVELARGGGRLCAVG